MTTDLLQRATSAAHAILPDGHCVMLITAQWNSDPVATVPVTWASDLTKPEAIRILETVLASLKEEA